MSNHPDFSTLRSDIDALGPPESRRRYPQPLRDRIAAYAVEQRNDGVAWKKIGEDLRVSHDTVKSFIGKGSAFKRLTISSPSTTLTMHGPQGVYFEGLSVASAAALIRALGAT